MATSAIVEKEFDRNLRPRERHRGFPKLALRQRSTDHPMIMFFLVVAAAFAAMAVVPSSGSAFALFKAPSVAPAPPLGSAEFDARHVGLSEIEIACHGQGWGAESAACLATIARESGRNGGRPVRVIVGS